EWTVDLSLDGPSRVEVRLAPRGDYAVSVRQSFEVEGQRKTQIENAYGRRFSGARVIAESFSDLGDLSQPVSLLAELEVPRITSPSAAGPSLAIPDDLFRTGESLGGLLGLEERDFDVILGNPRRSRLRVVYRLPEGVTVRSLPEERDIEARFGRFTLRFANEGRELVVERTIEIASPRVSVDDWPALRELISSIERLEEERIVLSRG
ncbi:MAG TPA: DUF3858 domain-containing protein, partial [Planctomycetota bacterium]|nr:DUF3858 domain-containing protein [Planctomycetota bacterium]